MSFLTATTLIYAIGADFAWPNGLAVPLFFVESIFETGWVMVQTTIRLQ